MTRTRLRVLAYLGAGLLAAAGARGALAAEAKLDGGAAAGTFNTGGKDVKLSFAAVFVDQKDERKPVILVLSDRKLPASSWKSETDYMLYRSTEKFVGVAFWMDGKRQVYRTDYYDGSPFPTSASGIFELELDPAAAHALTGRAHSTAGAATLNEPVKLDVRFNAVK